MQINKKKLHLIKLLVFLCAIVTVLSMTSCLSYSEKSREEIEAGIASISEKDDLNYTYVANYLRHWGLPEFDVSKLRWVESVFITAYNYDKGLPKTSNHAVMTANAFLEEYYDTIDLKDEEAVTDAIITCYVNAVGDPYSIYRPAEDYEEYDTDMSGKFGGIGVVVETNYNDGTMLVTSVYIDSPADKAGFKVGDYIAKVNGTPISEIGITNVIYEIRGKIGTTVTITVERDGALLDLVATREQITEKTVSYEITEEGYGYIAVTDFKGNTDEQFIEAVDALEAAGVKGIIFDMRNNLGGYLDTVCNMLSYIVPTNTRILSYRYKNSNEKVITAKDDTTSKGEVCDHVITVPMVVLCNEFTASAAEIFTSAIRDYRDDGILKAKTIGMVTYKKGIMQSTYNYAIDGSSVTLTVAYYNPPCGVNYHGIGVAPDIAVELDDSGTDNQFATAKNELKALINANNN